MKRALLLCARDENCRLIHNWSKVLHEKQPDTLVVLDAVHLYLRYAFNNPDFRVRRDDHHVADELALHFAQRFRVLGVILWLFGKLLVPQVVW